MASYTQGRQGTATPPRQALFRVGCEDCRQTRELQPPVIARKLGEEAVETVVAALSGSREELVGEAADTIFHLLVLLDAKGVDFTEVLAELDRREGTSGLDEKASRST